MIAKLVAAQGHRAATTSSCRPASSSRRWSRTGCSQKLNQDLIPNLEHIDPAFLGQRLGSRTTSTRSARRGARPASSTTRRVITRELTTWNDFIDAAQNEASGKIVVLDDPGELTGIYFWANGIDWTTDRHRPTSTPARTSSSTRSRRTSPRSTPTPGGARSRRQRTRYAGLERRRPPGHHRESPDPERWQWVLGSPATELWMDNWAILDGAPNPEAAHAFINYVLDPENVARRTRLHRLPHRA